ncbi:branched-chain amino acid ABC transporter permease, partial [Burkholderia pseudomallei]
ADEALRHDVPRVMTHVISAGTALPAHAAENGAPLAVIEPAMAQTLGSVVFDLIVIGGLGSLAGALVESLVLGCAHTFA